MASLLLSLAAGALPAVPPAACQHSFDNPGDPLHGAVRAGDDFACARGAQPLSALDPPVERRRGQAPNAARCRRSVLQTHRAASEQDLFGV